MKRHIHLLFLALLSCLSAAAENYPYRSDFLWVTVPGHADWLYEKGERAEVEVQLYKYGEVRSAARLHRDLRDG